jgi:hypothetical protein
MELADGHRVIWAVGMHRAQETKVIGMAAEERQHIGHKKPGLALVLEAGDRTEQAGSLKTDRGLRTRQRVRQHPARSANQQWLVIKKIHVGRTSLHEEENDTPGPRRKVRRLGG